MTRDEHLAWAEERALCYLDEEVNPQLALSSFQSDLKKHEETADLIVMSDLHAGTAAALDGVEATRGWIRDVLGRARSRL